VGERDNKFTQSVVPHLDSAYNLARWLTGNDQDAQDVVQDACLRAHRSIDSLRGADGRPWLLAIVRNASFTWLRTNRPVEVTASLDDPGRDDLNRADETSPSPEMLALGNLDRRVLNEAIAALPSQFREALILRELEELSYNDIARVTGAPIGTVMSRLARARRLLADSFQVILSHADVGGRK
jgi:RNA polymerase sigma-70 factor (ECF subfamily)